MVSLLRVVSGVIVIEDFAEGVRPYWASVKLSGDLMGALADGYFSRRVSPAWFRPGRVRLDFLVKLAKEFKFAGVIWCQLTYSESYKLESCYFPEILRRETGLPMLTVESDYDAAEVGPLRTRLEPFVESLRR